MQRRCGQGCPRTRDGTRPGGIDVHRTPAPSLPPHCSWRAAGARAASQFGPRASLPAVSHCLPLPRSGHPEQATRKPTHPKAALQTGETNGMCKEDAGADTRGRGMDSTPAESMSIGGLLPHLPPHCFWGAACAQAARHFGPRASLPAGSHRLPPAPGQATPNRQPACAPIREPVSKQVRLLGRAKKMRAGMPADQGWNPPLPPLCSRDAELDTETIADQPRG